MENYAVLIGSMLIMLLGSLVATYFGHWFVGFVLFALAVTPLPVYAGFWRARSREGRATGREIQMTQAREDLLDLSLDATFPASDPLSLTQPGGGPDNYRNHRPAIHIPKRTRPRRRSRRNIESGWTTLNQPPGESDVPMDTLHRRSAVEIHALAGVANIAHAQPSRLDVTLDRLPKTCMAGGLPFRRGW